MFFWSKYPFVRVTLFFILGILTALVFELEANNILWLVFYSFLALVILIAFKEQWLLRFNAAYGLSLSLIFYLLGIIWAIRANNSHDNSHLLHQQQSSYYYGKVVSQPETTGDFIRLKLKTEAIKDNQWHKASGLVLVYLKLPVTDQPDFGDKLIITGCPQPIPPPKNPHEFDYEQYLAHSNIFHQHFVGNNGWRLAEKSASFSIIGSSIATRSYLEEKLGYFIKDGRALAVAKALILGDKEDLSPSTKNIYATAGAMHVLAVSGLHVGIVYFVLLVLLGQRPTKITRPWLVGLVVVPGLWAYAFITGLSPSVMRAVTMLSFLVLAEIFNRKSNALNTLALSAFILLLVNPQMIMAVGFQLSYLAVAGIIFMYKPIERLLSPSNSIIRYVWQISALSICAQLATATLSAFYFNQFPTYFLFSNLLVIPAAILIVWGGLSLLVLGVFIEPIGLAIGWFLTNLINGLNYLLLKISILPSSSIGGLAPTVLQVVLIYLLLALIYLYISSRRHFKLALVACLLIIGTVWYKEYSNYHRREIVFYSVGTSWAIDLVERDQYWFLADSALLYDSTRIKYLIQPNRLHNHLTSNQTSAKTINSPALGQVLVWHDKKILIAKPCLAPVEIPLVFDFVVYTSMQTDSKCYREQILIRKFVENELLTYVPYDLDSNGAMVVDI